MPSLVNIKPSLNRRLFLLVIFLVAFGLVMIYNASVVDALRDFGNKLYYFKLQAKWAGFGLITMLVISRIPAQKWISIAAPLWLISLLSLALVLIPGIGNKYLGARRWIEVGSLVFQPAEAAKFSLVVYLAALLGKKPKIENLLVSLLVSTGLIMLEPDLGTSIVILSTGLMMYFVSGGPLRQLLLTLPVIVSLGLLLILGSPYRRQRLLSYLNPDRDPQGSSYHIRQALIGIGNGGFFGVGLGQSRQKYQYLPEVTTDSIFAVVGEELGFLGAAFICAVLYWLVFICFSISQEQSSNQLKLLGSGMSIWIGTQLTINLGAIVGILPFTGVPLPLISYGGSSLLVTLASIGVILSLGRKP